MNTSNSHLFFAAIIAVLVAGAAIAAQSGTFNVTVTITNTAPTIPFVNSTLSYTPVESTNSAFQFYFNATDANGASDLNDATAQVVVTLGGESATSSACTPTDDGNTVAYNCSVTIPFYYAAGTWAINASVSDSSASYAENTTATFTRATLKAITLSEASLSFSGTAAQNDVLASEGAQIITNTGNYNFVQLNLTAYAVNATWPDYIGAGNFSVNVTASSGPGQALVNNTAVQVADLSLNRGAASTETLYIYLDIPSGVTTNTYTASSSWVIDAN